MHARKKDFVLISNFVGKYLKFDVHEDICNEPNVIPTLFIL